MAGCAGAVALVSGVIAALGDLSALAFVAAAAGALAGGLAIDMARRGSHDRAGTSERGQPPVLVDAESGFFIEVYFTESLRARVATARRVLRPLSIGFLEITDTDDEGRETGAVELASIREAIITTLREADMAFRVGDFRLAVMLEDTPEDGAVWTVERIRRALGTEERGMRLHAGVASYPSHGLTSDELRDSAEAALAAAKQWPQDRIEVAGE